MRHDDGSVTLEQEDGSLYCFDLDKITAAADRIDLPNPTREEVIAYWQTAHIGVPVDRVDTEEYSFLYMQAGTPHGRTDYLLYVMADGSWHNFADDFAPAGTWGTRTFREVAIDQDHGVVRFSYGEDSYEIDLAAGTMQETGA